MKFLKRNLDLQKAKAQYKEVVWMYDSWGKFTENKGNEKALNLANIVNGQDVLEVARGTGVVFE